MAILSHCKGKHLLLKITHISFDFSNNVHIRGWKNVHMFLNIVSEQTCALAINGERTNQPRSDSNLNCMILCGSMLRGLKTIRFSSNWIGIQFNKRIWPLSLAEKYHNACHCFRQNGMKTAPVIERIPAYPMHPSQPDPSFSVQSSQLTRHLFF